MIHDLAIIGAGIAGLNALFVVAEHRPGASVVLIDRRAAPGGMWHGTYDYVRLHQPHPMFTAGDIAWDWSRPRGHLASREEVTAHMAHCLDILRARLNLTELWGHEAGRREERGDRVAVSCEGAAGPATVEARELIDAAGLDVPVAKPLPLASRHVVSTTPHAPDTGAPTVIVGGGKTGMDTALRLLRARPGRPVAMLAGRGTTFACRDDALPEGPRRWTGGNMMSRVFTDVSMRFDGTNEDEVFAYMRERYCVSPTPGAEQFLFGILSRAERDEIAAGVPIRKDYLEDVEDREGGPAMRLRSGGSVPVAPGTAFVNCTGYVLRRDYEHAPYVSPGGRVLSIGPRSAVHFLTSVQAYFLTHLMMEGRLAETPLHVADFTRLRHEEPALWGLTTVSLSLMNLLTLLDVLPARAFARCGLDLDRWYPLPRRMMALADAKLNGRRYRAHCRAALARVERRTGLDFAPIAGPAPAREAARAGGLSPSRS